MSRKVVSITEQLVLPILEQMGLELVEVEFVEEGKNRFLRVYIDKEGGVDIEECGKVSESLSKKLDEVDPIPYAYFLEVSSPGAERPLKTERDYERAIGKGVHIETLEPVDGKKVLEGILLSTDPLTVEVEGKEITFSKENVTFARLAILIS
ncbi:ribosome maturation factor [[Clostridium] ultunense Esp]|uniref:ribosome maturation factor RimP n=1 Tax=Thermicanus aegyptius TaxID=94009 RepID=UPI0002B6F8BD|nr:ribosome maturation factor RimP [Thermicanus aegyptius]CCQ97945.1 ribosome maturation factor [[Clostridium] ultunense Esp]